MWEPKFSLGYNFDYEGFLGLLRKYPEYIESVYFPVPRKIMGSGRILDEPFNYQKELVKLAWDIKDKKIRPIMLLNSTMVSASQARKVLSYAKKLYDDGVLQSFTVTDPYLMAEIKKIMPNAFIEASTLCRVSTVQEAKYIKDAGADRITTDRETIRDIVLLRKISGVLPIKVLANEGCIKNCVNRYAHYNMLCSNIDDEPIFPLGKKYKEDKKRWEDMDNMCTPIVKRYPHKVFSSPFIRPEDLHRYKEVSSVFKLSTRNFETRRVEQVLKAYINQKYNGNLVTLLNTAYIQMVFDYIDNAAIGADFFDKVASCNDNCEECSYCEKLLEKTRARIKYH